MKNYKKGFVVVVVWTLVAILAVGLVSYIYINQNLNNEVDIISENNVLTSESDKLSDTFTSPNKTYTSKNLGFTFSYPSEISVKEDEGQIILNHSIPYENRGCDMSGKGKIYTRLNDFNVILKIYNKPLIETVKIESPYMPAEYISNNKLVLSPGYIDDYKIGSLIGYSNYVGAEGCGYTTYYFPISNAKTLVVKSDQVQELSGILSSDIKEKILAIPGAISQENNKSIFDGILSSIRFTVQDITIEKASGIIKSVYSQNNKNYLIIDYVEMNPNWAPGGTSGPVYQNNNSQLRTFEISSNAKFMVDNTTGDNTDTPQITIAFLDFLHIFEITGDYRRFNPWDIVITDGVITQVVEHFIS